MPICLACGRKTILRAESFPGYVQGYTYDIYECPGCTLSTVSPCVEREEVYGWIYGWPTKVPGYSRYVQLADRVARSQQPDQEISRFDAVYEFVIRTIRKERPDGGRIAEIGSGLGSLTFSLRSAGYEAIGFDLSVPAVESASRNFGPFFRCDRIEDSISPGDVDIFVCTEVIEHVRDPLDLLLTIKGLMSQNSAILLTTPDKSAFPEGAVWETELPPIHLWWFTRDALEALASRAGLNISFVDVSRYFRPQFVRSRQESLVRLPTFDACGKLLQRDEPARARITNLIQHSPMLSPARWARRAVQRARGARPYSICAVLRLGEPETGCR